MITRRSHRFWFGLWLGWLAVLCLLSSLSSPGPVVPVMGFDKLLHFVWFACGGAALAIGLAMRRAARTPANLSGGAWRGLALIVIMTGAAVGAMDEWHQTFTPGRSGLDFYDWLADVAGSMGAAPIARWWLKR